MTKAPSTNATRLLKQAGVSFTEHMYRYEEHGGTKVSARELGVPEHAVIKTLVMEDEKGAPLASFDDPVEYSDYIGEAAVPGFSAVIHYGLLAPPGTPRETIGRLNTALNGALALDDVRSRLTAEGALGLPGPPEAYAADIDAEETKWGALVRKLNLRME